MKFFFSKKFYLLFFLLLIPSLVVIFSLFYQVENKKGFIFQEARPADKFQDPKSKFLSGSIYKLFWSEIEAEEGRFNWDIFDKDPLVSAVKSQKKKLAVKFQLQGTKGKPTIPSWVKTKIVEGENTKGEYADWPVFWDKTFQEKFENFLRAVAKRYDGDPSIEFFWFEETALGYPRAEKAWIDAGYTNVDVYKNTLIQRVKTYKNYFKKTPLMQMVNKFRKSDEEWFREHPEDTAAMWEFVDFLVREKVYLGTPSFYQSEDEANYHDKNLIWPIFKKYQDRTKIVVFIDQPHSEKIENPALAMKNLFSSFKVDYLFLYPALAYDIKWQEALTFAQESLRSATKMK